MSCSETYFQKRNLRYLTDGQATEADVFSLVTYNILSDYWIKEFSAGEEIYNYCPKEFKFKEQGKHSPRHKLLMAELIWLDSDIVALQEVDADYFSNALKPDLSEHGYQAMYAEKSMNIPEGVALAFKTDKFLLEEFKIIYFNDVAECIFEQPDVLKVPDVMILAALRHKRTKSMLVIGGSHIRYGDFLMPVTQLCEIALVTHCVSDMVLSLKASGEHVSYVICGDFNIEPQFPAYELLTSKKLSDAGLDKLKSTDHVRFPNSCDTPKQILPEELSLLNQLKGPLLVPLTNLQSAYKTVMGTEPHYTDHEEGANVWTLDYIWFDSKTMAVSAVLDVVPKSIVSSLVGLPNQFFPSDHVSLKAFFKFK